TPIIDEKFREAVKDDVKILERLSRGKIFCNYLDKCWFEANFNNPGFNWITHSKSIREEISRIEKTINS
ncbi:MAG TPA: hypothetical protein VGD89_03370, partial [Flavipsychrobacter sp.]